jgi:hypothetical protein
MTRGFAMTRSHLNGQLTATGSSYRTLFADSEAIMANRELAASSVFVYRPTSAGAAPRAGESVRTA